MKTPTRKTTAEAPGAGYTGLVDGIGELQLKKPGIRSCQAVEKLSASAKNKSPS